MVAKIKSTREKKWLIQNENNGMIIFMTAIFYRKWIDFHSIRIKGHLKSIYIYNKQVAKLNFSQKTQTTQNPANAVGLSPIRAIPTFNWS